MRKPKVVFYETFVSAGTPTIEDVLGFVDRVYDKRMERVALRPSGTAYRSSQLKNRQKDMITSLTNRCSRQEIEEGMAVLEAFDLDRYHSTEPLQAI